MSHTLANALIRFIEVVCFFGVGFVLEIAFTADRSNTRRNVVFNLLYTIVFQAVELTGVALLLDFASSRIHTAPLHDLLYFGKQDDGHSVALGFGLIAATLIFNDLFYYWFHRAQHSSRWLWAEHELHHSDECMNVTTTWRHHWLEHLLQTVFIAVPMLLLLKPPNITVLSAIVAARAMSYFIHLNARIRLGVFGLILATPHFHRVHHSKRPEHIDRNFAAIFSFWDVIFGTYHNTKKHDWPETGLASGRTVYSLREAVLMPFVTWLNMLYGFVSVKE